MGFTLVNGDGLISMIYVAIIICISSLHCSILSKAPILEDVKQYVLQISKESGFLE